MRKVLLFTLFAMLIFSGSSIAQVLADFEATNDGFGHGYGNAITNVYQTTDPSALSDGSLAFDFDATGSDSKGAVAKSNVVITEGELVTFYLWLPADTPDSILVKVYSQDQSWTWADYKFYACLLYTSPSPRD